MSQGQDAMEFDQHRPVFATAPIVDSAIGKIPNIAERDLGRQNERAKHEHRHIYNAHSQHEHGANDPSDEP